MTTIINYKEKMTALFAIFAIYAITLMCATYKPLSIPYSLKESKIEECVIVQKNDSVTTVIIPDKR